VPTWVHASFLPPPKIHGIYKFIPKGETMSRISIQMFYYVCRKMCTESDPRRGALEIGFSTMTMLLLTLLCLCWNFLSKIAHLLFHTLFTPL
jgi:hypothetical protein